LANNTVNQSQIATFRMNQEGASPCPANACTSNADTMMLANVDDKHHGVAPLHAWVELAEGVDDRRADECAIEHRTVCSMGARGTVLAAAGGLKVELPNTGFLTLSAIFSRPT